MSATGLVGAACHVCHCGKRFLRREHLRRHQATHGQPSFVCQACQRSFTRSDLLRRHIARHATEAIPKSRIRIACYACHSNKTKCDGGSPCLLCTKRDIECLYDRSSASAAAPAELSHVSAQELISSTLEIASVQNQNEQSGLSPISTPPIIIVDSTQGPQNSISSASVKGMSSVLQALNSSHGSLDELLQKSCGEPNAWSTTCIDTYMEYFHNHWPIIHGPTFNLVRDPLMLSASVILIGCWLEYPKAADELVVTVHETLVDKLFSELCNQRSGPRRELPWEVEKYAAVLLNIIFAFYSNREKLITRALKLLGLFTAELREIGFFSPEIAAYQEKTHFPGSFLPFVLSNRERRTRLVSSLFKIDTYLSLISGRCPSLQIEELSVDLTSTFTVWNAHGLDKFYSRYQKEPPERAGIRLVDFLRRPELLGSSAWLVEDVHLGLCGIYWAVWRYNIMRKNGGVVNPQIKEQLVAQLDLWKAQLDRSSNLYDGQEPQAQSPNSSLRFYFGSETERSPSTLRRLQSLICDSKMLYNILGLHIYSDTTTLSQLALTPVALAAETSASYDTREHNADIRSWALSVDGRKALSFCIAAIDEEKSSRTEYQHQERLREPLANLALSSGSAALSTWIRGPA